MTQSKVAGLILAGGQGSRMGGVDKGLVELDGRPLVAHVIERLGPQVDTLIINANRNAEAYAGFGLPVLADRSGGFVGPLAGLDAALAAPAGRALDRHLPLRFPFLPLDLVGRLLAAAEAENAELAMPVAEGSSSRCSCWPAAMSPNRWRPTSPPTAARSTAGCARAHM